jgi:hypothetical protein
MDIAAARGNTALLKGTRRIVRICPRVSDLLIAHSRKTLNQTSVAHSRPFRASVHFRVVEGAGEVDDPGAAKIVKGSFAHVNARPSSSIGP